MGLTIYLRVLFDTGSEVNLILAKIVKRANVPSKKFAMELEGVTGVRVADRIALVKVTPWFSANDEINLTKVCVVLKQLPMAQRIDSSPDIEEFKHIVKADPNFHKAGFADLLLGIDTWSEIICPQILRSSAGVVAQSTSFGYAIFGAMENTPNQTATVATVGRILATDTIQLDKLLERFWENEEEMPDEQTLSVAEIRAIEYYEKTTKRTSDGRFIVRIPFIEGDITLGDSRKTALQRFYQLEQRLERKPELRHKYNISMREEIESKHMRLATIEERTALGYFIPHHPITSRFRIVKDGSCITSNGKSVNDIQLAGPNQQKKLAIVTMRFRFHQYVLVADIKKMFLQILMNEEDLKYQKIFWRFTPKEPLKEYVLTTVTFGMKSSPFLAIHTMLKMAKIYKERFPMASRATERERYVDDYMTGGDTVENVMEMYKQLNEMMQLGCFELGKWKSNCQSIIQLINQNSNCDDEPLELNDELTSILGVMWQPNSDCFTFQINATWSDKGPLTKRKVASAVASIYDPIGYLAPVIIMAKILLQEVAKFEVTWDEPLSEEFTVRWKRFYESLSAINNIKIPRWVQTTQGREIELIGFADASEKGYGAVIYVRCASGATVWANLLTSKTKVAPIKPISIPKLELNAAVLLADLMNVVRTECNLEYVPFQCYSDSKVALSWIRCCPFKLKIYFARRVQKINKHTPKVHWNYVPTKMNPADIASRGMIASELQQSELWWHGPSFIYDNQERRQNFEPDYTSEDQEIIQKEYKPQLIATVKSTGSGCITIKDVPLIARYSNLSKIVRITAYTFKAIKLLKLFFTKKQVPRNENTIGLLSSEQLIRAMNYWIRYEQRKHFNKEFCALTERKEIDKSSSILSLCPFIDSKSILRVRGRLANANVTYDERHPIIIPSHSSLSKLLLEEAHRETLHGGIQLMLHYVRMKYWIIRARQASAAVVKKCLACVRYRNNDHHQLMADLPKERLTNSRPFTHCGVDYFGPIQVKRFEGRCKSIDTGYAAVFVCMTTRMVHVECVSNLTTERFLWSLARLASIYQMPKKMFSDNAKTFIGAKNELQEVLKSWQSSEMENFLSVIGLQWKFITPRAPNQGGLWESSVKSTKHHMKRILKNQLFTFERYQTLFAKISAVLNSRPLVPLSDNPTDLNYLTPSHAVIGERTIQPLSENLSLVPMNKLKQQSVLDKIQQDFWNVWRKEYIGTLQNRYKWKQTERNLLVGDFVLLKEDNVPPGVWPVARVIETYPGADNLVRSVKIRTPKNDYVRPICKLVWIPLEEHTKADETHTTETNNEQCDSTQSS